MPKQYTCGNCPHLTVTSEPEIIGCGKTGNVIPHTVDYVERRVRFTRIPVDCPLDDPDLVKSEKPAPVTKHKRRNLDALRTLKASKSD